VTSADASAPFWHGLGRHFHSGPIPRDDAFFPTAERSHIARLMPKHPLYSSFIGVDAQGCIGQRALSGRAAAEALHTQGFRYRGHIDIFDAGPIVEVDVADLHAVRASRLANVRVAATAGAAPGLVAVGSDLDFRCGLVAGTLTGGSWTMAAGAARSLGVESGQRVRVLRQIAVGADPD
jgi:arginine N-succinyltransferase